jgi:cell division septum initiation protein DivIVA
MGNAEELARQAGDRVREVIADAERQAAEILERAEQEAAHIRERAEAEARDKLERARRALSELAGETPDPRPPAPAPEPPTPRPDPSPPPEPTPEPPSAVDGAASVPSASNGGDDSAARLVAMKMALDGSGREQIAAELDAKFGASDRAALLDDVLARAGR